MPTTPPEPADTLLGRLLGRLPRLREVAGTAAYLASYAAGAMTGVVINLT